MKVNAAASLAGPSTKPSSTPGEDTTGGGIEPHVANLCDNSNKSNSNGTITDGGTSLGGALAHPIQSTDQHHPTSAVSRDTGARGSSGLGRDNAATLLQSRVRGYNVRRHVACTSGVGGTAGTDGGVAMGTAGTAAYDMAGSGTGCPVLDLEVRAYDGAPTKFCAYTYTNVYTHISIVFFDAKTMRKFVLSKKGSVEQVLILLLYIWFPG